MIGVIYGYTQSLGLSFYDRLSVYATDSSISRQDLIDSFTAYCKSRNVLVNGTLLGSAAEWIGSTLENTIDVLGIDMNYLQAQINKETSGNLGVRWLISANGIGLYNRILAELLQREELEVGDTDVYKKVYSGDTFTDYDGNKCLVYYVDSNVSYAGNVHVPLKFGTPYKYTPNQLYNMQGDYASYTPYEGKTFRDYITPQFNDNFANFVNFTGKYIGTEYEYKMLIRATRIEDGKIIRSGHRAIFKVNGSYYFGHFLNVIDASPVDPHVSAYYWTTFESPIPDPSEKVDPTDVTVMTPTDKPIKPDLPDDKPVTIDPDGNTDIPSDPDPSGPDIPDWGTDTEVNPKPDGDGWDIPFTMPNLNIDWSLKDIGHKFPFCIPSDIVSFYRTLSVEPEAPSIDAHIPLGSFYDWHFVADFSQYDRWAVIIRAVEYVGFVIGLIYFTVRLVKG